MKATKPRKSSAATRRRSAPEDACAFAVAAARLADEGKIEGVCVLDLRGLSNLADYFVIGTGTSGRQMHAALDRIGEHAAAVGREVFSRDDRSGTSWLLADYVDVVVHLFDEEHRAYYDLDGLWGDAPQIDWHASAAQAEAR